MTLVIVKTVFLLGRVQLIYAAYQGCYQDSPVSRELYVNPGNYDPSYIDATECENLCGRQGYGYAGLTAGKVCLCGQTISSSPTGTCDVTCPGDVTQTCGTSDIYDSVYTAPVTMTGFKIVPANEVMETYALSTINFNITGGTSLIFNGTIYDGGPSFGPLTTQSVNYNIRRSGEVGITANVTSDIETLFDEKVLKVQTRVKQLTLSCEETVVMQTRFDCYLTVAMGTNLNISVDMGDGKVYTLKSSGML
ncbi:unnamed protein product [Mytilus coruscus]|uniref:WSC domain-containing protein n=1 Tax=Mytilus coruscus TaxID=42192 RepID=A0A6J8BAE5_MYTCO|nr:unnamed protein product [Mytilus coruscus]